MKTKETNGTKLGLLFLLMVLLVINTACTVLPPAKSGSAGGNALFDSERANIVLTGWSEAAVECKCSALLSIADVVAMAKPSVVAIDTEVTYRAFRGSVTRQGAGSGWIVDPNGTIVTNNHVVAGANSIKVTLADGMTFTVDPDTVICEPSKDLAVLRIDAENLLAAKIGDSSALRVGDWLVAIGNPLGLGISAKEGIVSRLNVSLAPEGRLVEDLIETSAAINPGNSGGPLVNMNGEVIGITSAKIASEGVEGLGYAISIDEAMPIIERLMGNQ